MRDEGDRRLTKGTRGPGDRRRGPPDLAINRDQRGPGDQGTGDCDALTKGTGGPEGTGDCDALTKGTGGDQRGPATAIDSTTSAKIARYTERKQLAYKLTDEGVLLLPSIPHRHAI